MGTSAQTPPYGTVSDRFRAGASHAKRAGAPLPVRHPGPLGHYCGLPYKQGGRPFEPGTDHPRRAGCCDVAPDDCCLSRAEQQPTRLLPQPGGFDGFRVSQKVADANDLPRSKVKDFPDFLAELDGGRPGGQVDVTEGEDRLAEVAELLGPIGEAFPRLAAVLPQIFRAPS